MTHDPAPALRVAIYQYAARDETPADRLTRLDTALAGLGKGGADLMVCPELFLSGYHVGRRIAETAEPLDGPFAKGAAALAVKWDCALLYGYPERADGRLYNSAACFGRDGRLLANHRKLHLPDCFEREYFAVGDALTFFTLGGRKVGLLICYDVEFPEAVRAAALGGAELVLVPTALVDRWGFVAHKMIPTRAFENGVFLAYANYAGREGSASYLGGSVLLAPDGEELARAGAEEEVIAARLDPARLAAARGTIAYLDDRRVPFSGPGNRKA